MLFQFMEHPTDARISPPIRHQEGTYRFMASILQTTELPHHSLITIEVFPLTQNLTSYLVVLTRLNPSCSGQLEQLAKTVANHAIYSYRGRPPLGADD